MKTWIVALSLGLSACASSSTGSVSTMSSVVSAPGVLLGEADLTCEISMRANGVQRLTITKGGGIEFNATVGPLIDGTVSLKSPSEGARYRFTSRLVQPAEGTLSGVGKVTIEQLDTKVSVDVTRYEQPGGPGTVFTFSDGAVVNKGVYVEFVGMARAPGGAQYAFRVNLGPLTMGSGRVTPADSNFNTKLASKEVNIKAQATTVVSTLR